MVSFHSVDDNNITDPRQKEKHDLFLLMIMAILGLLTIFVETMLVPAMPRIAKDLSVQSSDLAWVLTAYTLAGAIAIPIAGKLGEMWGRKRVLFMIMAIYMVGLVGAAISWDLLSLVVFRAIQGVGMGAITLLMGMAKDVLPARMVPVGIGLISAMIGVGAAMGMVVGSLLISFIGWKEAFWVILPVTILIIGIVYRSVPDTQEKHPMKMDVIGSLLLGLGLLAFLLPLSQGEIWGWSSMLTIGLFASSVLIFITFVIQEMRCDEPIVRLELLRNRNISVAYITMFLMGIVMFMMFQTLPFFLGMPKGIGGFGITSSVIIGLFMLPNAVGQLISSPIGGKIGLRVGHGKILIAGLFVAFAGFIALSFLHSSQIGVLIAVAIFGLGLGLSQTGNTNLISVACSKENFGSTTAVNSMILTVGMSVGPVLASLIIGMFAEPIDGYVFTWVIAGVLSLLTSIFVLMNMTKLSHELACAPSQDDLPPESA